MHVPPGGGPPPHRYDFEGMSTVLDGDIEITSRGEKAVARAGQTVDIPADAPHSFTNASGASARLLCMGSPAGLEELFSAIGAPVEGRTAPPPELDAARPNGRSGKGRPKPSRRCIGPSC